MSDFIRQNASEVGFSTSDSWVILSPIEQSIKRKIESVGVPLKDWDIQINYGIKTGFNDAFIISTQKRNEILANCANDAERKRTEELIRPILRGRDIKRYGYNWADLWLIATFPSRNYDIELYPAVKEYLLAFGVYRLEQTGKTHIIDGMSVKSRKKTNNKWFETQDSISYWEDFSKPKIIYPETTQGAYFAIDTSFIFADKTCFILLTKHPRYLQSTLSSKLYEFAYKRIFSSIELGLNGYQYNKHALVKLPVKPSEEDYLLTESEIYSLYNISDSEQKFIESL